ncbi:MAG TPA: hypothetical protein VGA63_13025 [Geopsychrobacteraceae bacterium]|jgi:hypothetical protein
MTHNTDIKLGITALAIYVLGGLATFSGIALMTFWKGRDLWGWGEGRSVGVLLLCVGIGLSLAGVLMMRIFRNRGLA